MGKVRLGSASLEDLKKELRRRQAALPALISRRDELNRKIQELQALGQLVHGSAARKAGPARLMLAEALPEDVEILPAPEDLA
jgi:hypothetical protein